MPQGAARIRDFDNYVSLNPPTSYLIPDTQWHSNVMTHLNHVRLSNGSDRYVSCSKDGLVKVWNPKVSLLGFRAQVWRVQGPGLADWGPGRGCRVQA